MTKSGVVFGGLYGFLAVALGAFAAHGLQATASERALHAVDTGAHYALVHAVALLALAAFGDRLGRLGVLASWAFVIGVALFSGSLWLFGLTEFRTAVMPLPLITPMGGVALLIGWALVLVAGFRSVKQ